MGPHLHPYEPEFFDQYSLVDGFFRYGWGVHEWGYAHPHPTPDGGWCPIDGFHRHPYRPGVGYMYDARTRGYYYDRERARPVVVEVEKPAPGYQQPSVVVEHSHNPPARPVASRPPPEVVERQQHWRENPHDEPQPRAQVSSLAPKPPPPQHPTPQPGVHPQQAAGAHPGEHGGAPEHGATAEHGAPEHGATAAHGAPEHGAPQAGKEKEPAAMERPGARMEKEPEHAPAKNEKEAEHAGAKPGKEPAALERPGAKAEKEPAGKPAPGKAPAAAVKPEPPAKPPPGKGPPPKKKPGEK
jgi:hypothetical protein